MLDIYIYIYITPQGLVVKPGKNDRLIWDGLLIPHWLNVCINMLLSQDTEPEIIYGVSFMRYLEIIWNSRITHPDLDILLFDDDDVKRVFRYSKYHPGVASAFSLILSNHLFIYMWSTFSSITSLENFEPITRARTRLVEHLSDSTY